MHPARKPLATLAITLGTFLILLGAPALASAGNDNTVDLDASAIAETRPEVELAAADDDADGAVGSETDGGTDADGTAIVGVDNAAAADSVAVDSVAVSADSVVGPGGAVAADSAIADSTDTDGTDLVGTDQGGQNSNDAATNGDNGTNNESGENSVGASDDSTGDDGNTTGGDTGGEPSPAANDPVLANAGVSPTTLDAQNTDRDIPETGGPASMLLLMSGFGLIIAGVVILSHGRVRVARHRAA